jgi:hypothetical protein
MKIKLQEYGIISIKMMDDMIKELEGFKTGDILKDLPTRSLISTLEGLKQQLIPAEKLADICWEAAKHEPSGLGIYDEKEEFLNSEIEVY